MPKLATLFIALFFSLAVPFKTFAAAPAAVDISQFKSGNSWSWTYSQQNSASGVWEPYLVETYVLTLVKGMSLTFEMQSSSIPVRETPAHHRFTIDFTNCVRASQGGNRNWTMTFYTHSFGPNWELVSNTYENTAFSEKFNCIVPAANETGQYAKFDWNGSTVDVFAPPQASRSGTSFYFSDSLNLSGIAAQKVFSPSSNYKFEFRETRSAN